MISDEKENLFVLFFLFFLFLYEVGPSRTEETVCVCVCVCVCDDNSGTIREEKVFFFFFALWVGWQPRDSCLSRTLGSVRKKKKQKLREIIGVDADCPRDLEKNKSSGLDKLRVVILTRAARKFVVPPKNKFLSRCYCCCFCCLFVDLLQLRSLELSGHEILHLICGLACSSGKEKIWRCDQAAVATDCLLIEAFSLWVY